MVVILYVITKIQVIIYYKIIENEINIRKRLLISILKKKSYDPFIAILATSHAFKDHASVFINIPME